MAFVLKHGPHQLRVDGVETVPQNPRFVCRYPGYVLCHDISTAIDVEERSEFALCGILEQQSARRPRLGKCQVKYIGDSAALKFLMLSQGVGAVVLNAVPPISINASHILPIIGTIQCFCFQSTTVTGPFGASALSVLDLSRIDTWKHKDVPVVVFEYRCQCQACD